MTKQCDLAIVGAGPAGMAAALEADALGLSVVLLDDNPAPGGQIYRGLEQRPANDTGEHAGGRALIGAYRASGVDYRPDTGVWEVAAGMQIGVTCADRVSQLPARHVIIADGAMERPVPLPGATLPGVMGAGGAQILLKTARLFADGAIFAGSGPLLYLVVHQYLRAGAKIGALLDTAPPGNAWRSASRFPAALMSPGQLAQGVAWIAAIRRAGVPIHRDVDRLCATGGEQLEAVEFHSRGRSRQLPAAHLFLHQGVIPRVNLGMASGCRYTWDEHRLYWRPLVDTFGQSSRAGITFAGDSVLIQGAQAAQTHGALAAIGSAHQLGAISETERDGRASPLQRRYRRQLRMRPWLDVLYRPRDGMRIPADPAAVVCRCEQVTAAAIDEAVAAGCTEPNQVKAFTRCGMGPCQARMCGPILSEMLARSTATPVGENGYLKVRSPVIPLRVGSLAGMAGC